MTNTEDHFTATPGMVSEIPLPTDARALSSFSHVDYVDAFLIASDVRRTPQQWTGPCCRTLRSPSKRAW